MLEDENETEQNPRIDVRLLVLYENKIIIITFIFLKLFEKSKSI